MKAKDKKGAVTGRLICHDVSLKRHERMTIATFLEQGQTIELIPTAKTDHQQRPDFLMNGLEWEMKSPIGDSKSTIEHSFKKAARQSCNIIIDLRRTPLSESSCLTDLKKLFATSKRVRRLKVISKNGKVLDL